MPPDRRQPDSFDEMGSLTGLRDGLRRLDAASQASIPEGVSGLDAAMRERIRAHFAGQSEAGTSRTGWSRGWRGIAAVVAAASVIMWFSWPVRPPVTPVALTMAEPADVDHDGRVTVLDAFAFARAVHRVESRETMPDINRDGRMDQADVDAIAGLAVTLSPSTRESMPRGAG